MNQPENMTLKATVEHPSSESGFGGVDEKKRSSLSDLFSWPGRIALLMALVLSPWPFASVENWAQSLITIALLVGLGFWWFETALNRRKSQVLPYIGLLVFLGLLIGIIQTISLPDWIAQLMVGRQQEIYKEFSGNADSSVSISLNREGTWNQIRMLVIAISGLLLGCRFFRTKRDIVLLMSVVAVNGVAIGFFGIIHKLTDNGKMYWAYEVAGLHFGSFVNRNNAAGYLLMCLGCCLGLLPIVMAKRRNTGSRPIISKELPIWRRWYFYTLEFVSELTATKVAVLICAILIATAILTTLSRGGVVGLLVASMGTILIYGMARKPKNFGFVFMPLIAMMMALFGWIGFGEELVGRFDRIDMVDVGNADSRVQNWRETWPAVTDMGKLGSGLGSYKNVHRIYRKSQENQLYVYAENQYFQSLVEAGWLGLVLFLLAWLLAYKYASLALFQGSSPTTIGIGTMGVFVVFSQSVVSFFDFGLYIPANMLLLAVLMGFLAYHCQALALRLKEKSWLCLRVPNYLVQLIVLVFFAATTLVALDLYRRSSLDRLMKPHAVRFNRFNMDLETTDERIAALTARVRGKPSVELLNYAGELWMHRARLVLFDSIVQSPDYTSALAVRDDTSKSRMINNLWNLTNIQQMQGTIYALERDQSKYQVMKFLAPIRESLVSARRYFMLSRQIVPLQPLVHLRLGELNGVIGETEAGDVDMERAMKLAPSNPAFRRIVGIYYLQSGNVDGAIEHLNKYLELMPQRFSQLMSLITGRTGRNMARVDEDEILEIIPNNGRMLYDYVEDFMSPESEYKNKFLERAAQAVEALEVNLRENDVLLGDIRRLQGGAELKNAIRAYNSALNGQPNDHKTRYNRARIHVKLGDLDAAFEDASYLVSRNKENQTYNRLLEDVQVAIEFRDKDQ